MRTARTNRLAASGLRRRVITPGGRPAVSEAGRSDTRSPRRRPIRMLPVSGGEA